MNNQELDLALISEQGKKLEALLQELQEKELALKDLQEHLLQLTQQHQKILQETIDYYENIIAQMPGHVYWLDVNNIFLGCNDLQAQRANLKSRKEIIGKTNYDMIWKDQAEQLNAINLEVMRTGVGQSVEEFAIMANGPAVYQSHKVPIYNKEGTVVGVLGISFDITAQKEKEILQVERARAEKAHEVAEEYAKHLMNLGISIAHEIRTPLASIQAAMHGLNQYLPLLMEHYKQFEPLHKIPVRRLNILGEIPDSVKREINFSHTIIDMLLMNIKQFGILHQEYDSRNYSVIPINQVLQEALTKYPFTTNQQQQWINWEPTHNFEFYGSLILTIHIIYNLLNNSLYYIQAAQKGSIYIWLSQTEDFNQVHFKDTALGMSETIQQNLFKEFYSQRPEGIGIGLAFCKRVMNSYEGTISCDSKEGEYTEFVLKFPRVNPYTGQSLMSLFE